MRNAILPSVVLLLAACATVPAGPDADGVTWSRLNQTVAVDGPRITPLRVLEDSRCPMEARCVWAGRLRLELRVHTGAGNRVIEIATDKPVAVADGSLELVSVMPPASTQRQIEPGDYRFGFRFAGGL